MTIGLTVPLVATATAALKFSADFQTVMVKVGTLTNLGVNSIGKLRNEILALAPTVGVGPKALAEGLLIVASTGLDAERAMQVLAQAAKASAVGLGEVKDIGRSVTAAIKAYADAGLTAEEATNKLFVAVREGGAETNEMAGQLGRVVGIAQQMGVSFDEVLASIATFTRLGVDAATATTGLRATIIAMLHPSQQAREALEGMGTSIEEVRKTIREKGLAVALQELLKLADGDADAIGRIIPEARALASTLGTAGALAQDYNDVLKNIKATGNDLNDAFGEMTKTLGFKWSVAVAKAQGVLLQFGDAIAPVFGKLLEFADPVVRMLSAMVRGFEMLPKPVQAAAIGFGILLAAVGPLTFEIGSLIAFFGYAATAAAWFATQLGVQGAAAVAASVAQQKHIDTIIIDVGAKAAATRATQAYTVAQLELAGATVVANRMLQSTSLVLAGAGAKAAQSGGIIDGVIIETGAAAAKAAPAIGLLTRALVLLQNPITWIVGTVAALLTATHTWDEFGRILKAVGQILANSVLNMFDTFVSDVKAMANAVSQYGAPIISFLDKFFGISRDAAAFEKGMEKAAKGLELVAGASARDQTEAMVEQAKKRMEEIRKLQLAASAGGIDPAKTMDFGVSLDDGKTRQVKAYVDELAAAQKQLASLNADQRANISAGLKMGASVEDITARLNKMYPALNLTEAATKLYQDQIEIATKASDKFAEAMKRVAAAGVPLTAMQQQMVIKFENLGLSAEEMAPAVGASAEAITRYTKTLDNLAEMTQWVTEKQEAMKKAMSDRALAQGNAEMLAGLKSLRLARQQAADAFLTGIDAEVMAIARRRDADIEAIQAEMHAMQWNKDERIKLVRESANREIELRRAAFNQIEELAQQNGTRTLRALRNEYGVQKMWLEFMKANRSEFGEHAIKVYADIVHASGVAAGTERLNFKEMFREVANAINEVAAAWSQFAQVTEQGSVERKFAEVANATSIIVGDVAGLLEAKDAIGAIIAAIKLAVDAARLLWDALSVSNGEDVARRVGKRWGIAIGEELGNAIWETAKKTFGGDKFAAELAHMQDIIAAGAESAGVTKEVFIKANFDSLIAQLRDVFSLVQMGTLTVGQSSKILDENFGDLLKAGTSAYGFVNEKILETIRLTQELGIESQAITKFMQDMSSQVADGLFKIAKGTIGIGVATQDSIVKMQESFISAADKAEYLEAQIKDLNKKPKSEWTEKNKVQMKQWTEELKKTQREMETLRNNISIAQKQVTDFAKTGQEGFDRFGRLAVVAFATGLGSGKSFMQVIEEMGPALDEAAKAQDQFGLKASGAFGELVQLRRFIQDNKELVGTLDGVNQMMVGLKNSGMLTKEAFADLSKIAVDTFDQMVKKGLPARQAIVLMQPTLQRIWELQQDFGFEVDESTQKLIDQAKEAGVVGEAHRSAADKMVLALDRVVGVLELIAIALGVTLPEAAKTGAKKTQDELDKLNPRIDVEVRFPKDFPDFPDFPGEVNFPQPGVIQTQFGGMVMPSGKVKHFQFGGTAGPDTIPALLAPGETVRTAQQEAHVQRELERGGTTVIKLYLRETEIAEVMVDGIGRDGKVLTKLTKLVKQRMG